MRRHLSLKVAFIAVIVAIGAAAVGRTLPPEASGIACLSFTGEAIELHEADPSPEVVNLVARIIANGGLEPRTSTSEPQAWPTPPR